MACDTQYSVMSTVSLYCSGKNNKSAHVEWRCFFPFYFLWMVCWLNPWPQNTRTWRGDSLWHSFLTSWPLDPWVQLRFSFLALKWRRSNAAVIFPGQADVLFSPLFLISSPSLPFIWPSTPIGLDFMLTLRAPGCHLLTITGFKIRVLFTKMDIELRCPFLGSLRSTAETISGLW